MPPSRTDSFGTLTNTTGTILYLHNVPRTRTVTRATSNQLLELNKIFQDTDRPTREVKIMLSQRTRLLVSLTLSCVVLVVLIFVILSFRTVEWISSWFIRQRKKQRSANQDPNFSPPDTMGMREPSAPSYFSTKGSSVTTTPAWSQPYASASSAPDLSPSIATAQPMVSLSGLDRTSYIQIETTVNSTPPVWHALPPSHGFAATSQPIVSSAPVSGYKNLDNSSYACQYPPHVPHSSRHYQDMPRKVTRQRQSFYASTDSSGYSAADAFGRRVLFECNLDPQLESRLQNSPIQKKHALASHTVHPGGLSTNVSETVVSSPTVQEGISYYGHISPVNPTLNGGWVMMNKTKDFSAKTETCVPATEVSEPSPVISTPTRQAEMVMNPMSQGGMEYNIGSGTEMDLGYMSQVEARTHAEFETDLKIADMYGRH